MKNTEYSKVKSFAFFPTKLCNGKTVWLKFYNSIFVTTDSPWSFLIHRSALTIHVGNAPMNWSIEEFMSPNRHYVMFMKKYLED